jgi:hypothetical protein
MAGPQQVCLSTAGRRAAHVHPADSPITADDDRAAGGSRFIAPVADFYAFNIR